MATFFPAGIDNLAAVVGTHSCSKAGGAFLFAVGTAEGALSHVGDPPC